MQGSILAAVISSHLPEPLGSLILSGLIPFKIQTASITSFTPPGGLFIDLTIVISYRAVSLVDGTSKYCMHTCGVNVSRAAKADSRIGMASARSASHSSLMALAALACSLATASSCLTTYHQYIHYDNRLIITSYTLIYS